MKFKLTSGLNIQLPVQLSSAASLVCMCSRLLHASDQPKPLLEFWKGVHCTTVQLKIVAAADVFQHPHMFDSFVTAVLVEGAMWYAGLSMTSPANYVTSLHISARHDIL
jgi:hypothetical protein